MSTVIWTVGHSTRSLAELVGLLQRHQISLLVDVRTVPRSRRNPQFNLESLAAELTAVDIAHRHEPGLGGLRKPKTESINAGWQNPSFRGYADYMQTNAFVERLDDLITVAASERLALMCAEAVPWRCHRSLIADALTVRGVEVRHILGPDRADRHRLTPFIAVDGLKITYPGLLSEAD